MTPFTRNRRVRPADSGGELVSVLLAGGGTAGHVSPLLATADALRRRRPDLTVTALGTQTGLEARIVPARGYDLRFVPRVPLPRKPDANLVRFPGALRAGVEAAGRAIDETGAQVVVGFGGYVSSPAYLAARRRGIPIVVHEQNARPGFANRLGARLTPYVATTFAATHLAHATCIGMPLRREISTLDRAALRADARAELGLDADRTTLLVTGGSCEVSGLPRGGQRQRVRAGRQSVGRALHRAGVRRPDGPRICRRRPRPVPVGSEHGVRAHRGGAARRLCPAALRQR
ncbi:MAG: UDP-N-acetylglucosamine--N-acetylmuramyl-(pentapeptide) pyrophosphoryl-undecaprenol N-acetylglucosamine transferase [bacterium ADurb.BinA028]|nr:MAG: UDP-N-acetylglucosamine--N-acetylmuramyl-(pentapeptide) pyrophosphoryl-undecaprenol N-acetylglucosamine transferase [bacterium ADurb.BinA028]